MSTIAPRVVVVHRSTEWELLLAEHGTPGQARFFLEARGRNVAEIVDRHHTQQRTLEETDASIPRTWRRTRIARAELPAFLFEPTDIVLAVGQDGLVANIAKYLERQPVIGVNPDPARYEGTLVRTHVSSVAYLLAQMGAGRARIEERTMVEARLDDGQRLTALNEVYIGHRTHQSARYHLSCDRGQERQSSSGVIVATGTGATGWARSISLERGSELPLPPPTARRLAFFVREAWPSVSSGTAFTEGIVGVNGLRIVSEMNDGGVAFGDGIEHDNLSIRWGQEIEIGVATQTLRLVA